MRITDQYPNTYNYDKLAGMQHPVPSQNGPVPDPYYPVYPFVTTELYPSDPPNNTGFAVYTYDTRPPGGTDFTFRPQVIVTPDLGAVFTQYTVPDGYTFIVREVYIAQWAEPTVGPTMSPTGVFGGFTIGITVDDLPVYGYDQIAVDESWTGYVAEECFISVVEGSRVGITSSGFVPIPGFGQAIVEISGNLLLNTGRTASLEYTEQKPVPVTQQV